MSERPAVWMIYGQPWTATWTVTKPATGPAAGPEAAMADYLWMLRAVQGRWPFGAGEYEGRPLAEVPGLARELAEVLR